MQTGLTRDGTRDDNCPQSRSGFCRAVSVFRLVLYLEYMAHIHEQIDFAVEVLIVHKDKILLRKHEKYGIWLGVGGHVELDEDPTQAALREVKEEVGLDIELALTLYTPTEDTKHYTELIPPTFLNRHRISDTHEHIAFVYFARSTSDNVIPENLTDEWQWLDRYAVERNSIGMSRHMQVYALRALDELAS